MHWRAITTTGNAEGDLVHHLGARQRVVHPPYRTVLILMTAIAAGLSPSATVQGETGERWPEASKLFAPDPDAYDAFGESVSLDEGTLVVGVESGGDSGAAYVFERADAIGRSWSEVSKLVRVDGEDNDYFGSSVDLHGDTLVIGARGVEIAGKAYVYERHDRASEPWRLTAELTRCAGDSFGREVAIHGDTIAIAARGWACVFERNAGGPGAWGSVASLEVGLAVSIDIDQDTIVVGSSGDRAAFVLARGFLEPGRWDLAATLTGGDRGFGHAVAIDGDLIAISADQEDEERGAAYVFERTGDGPEDWDQVARLTAFDGIEDGSYFGDTIDVERDTVVVGTWRAYSSFGAAYVFERDSGGPDSWEQVTTIRPRDVENRHIFGGAVALDGESLVVGALGDDQFGMTSVGSAYVFRDIADPVFDIAGSCPGEVTLSGSGLAPNRLVQLFVGPREGTTPLPPGNPCAGVDLDLGEARPLFEERANEEGEITRTRTLSDEDTCELFVQAVDTTSCAKSLVFRPVE